LPLQASSKPESNPIPLDFGFQKFNDGPTIAVGYDDKSLRNEGILKIAITETKQLKYHFSLKRTELQKVHHIQINLTSTTHPS
jgi:hypothetical protein